MGDLSVYEAGGGLHRRNNWLLAFYEICMLPSLVDC